MTEKVLIAGAVQTPIGSVGGGLSSIQAEDLAVTVRRSLFDLSGLDLNAVRWGGSSDANLAAAVGTPTIDGFGPSGEGAHQIDECIVIDDVPRRLALLSELVLSLAVPPEDWLSEEALAY